MSLPMTLMLTSQQCGHCLTLRGTTNGKIMDTKTSAKAPATIPGGNKFDAAFFKQLMTGSGSKAQTRLLLVHMATRGGTWSDNRVLEISIIQLEESGTEIRQTIFTKNPPETVKELESGPDPKIEATRTTMVESYKLGDKRTVITASTKTDNSWKNTVNTYIAEALINYMFFYPSFLVFRGDQWDTGVKDKVPMYGVINGMETDENPPWGFSKKQPPKIEPKSPLEFLSDVFSGRIKLEQPAPQRHLPEPSTRIPPPSGSDGASVCRDQKFKLVAASRR